MHMSIAAAVATTTFELARVLQAGLATGQVRSEEVSSRLMELQQNILDMQGMLHDLAEENRKLKSEIAAQKSIEEIAKALVVADSVYFLRKSSGELDGPFCPTCWDDANKLIRLKFENKGDFSLHSGPRRLYVCVKHEIQFFLRDEMFNDITIR
jgi:hypothetical protein